MEKFNSSAHYTVGTEIELQILDPDSLDLLPRAETLLELCKANELERVKTEIHQSMLEVDSEISFTVKECGDYLKTRLALLHSIAAHAGLQLGVTGTHPFQHWEQRLISNTERYQYLNEKFRWLARRMNVYGLHVHVGMPSEERALAVSQAAIPYLPVLLALSANSPFWQGIDTGMQSSRISIMESLPFSGIPPYFTKWTDFEYYYNTLHRNQAITSLKDLYWYIRPNLAFGTIEFRICDALPTLSETMSLVALVHCLSVWISKRLDAEEQDLLHSQEHHWIAPHNLWIAARDGLAGQIITDLNGKQQKISDLTLELLEILRPLAKEMQCLNELDGVKQILSRGNGAHRQRESYHLNFSLREVVAAASREFAHDLKDSF